MREAVPAILLCLLLAFCRPAAPAHAVVLADDLGVKVELEMPPQRIVSLAPSNTELLFALGLGSRVVGVTRYCTYPEAASGIEKVADYNTISVEKVMALRPDLVVAARGNDKEGLMTLRRMGIQVFSLDIQSVAQLLTAIERLGRLGGVEAQAAELKQELEGRVTKVRARVGSAATRPRVMWGYWGEPIFTAGAQTMIDDVFTLAGGTNVGRQAPGAWPQVSLEVLVAWAPEVIVTTTQMGGAEEFGREIENLKEMDGWKMLPAVRDGRVYAIDGDLLNRPGPRLIDALEQIAAYLHPEVPGER
jgi:iron complex transport system substrate-binding protein